MSAFFAGVTAILAKVGVAGVNSNLATAIRTTVVLVFTWGIAFATNAPDVLVAMRWNAGTNAFGAPGLFVGSGQQAGSHGSLSPFDMHNTLVAAGPDFRRGFKDTWPTGNIDLAPTILWILGLQPAQKMDGRILSEALTGLKAPRGKPEQKTTEAANDSGSRHWRQYLKTSSVGDTIYFDEGNAMK